jgi:hypothetical protein
MERLRAALRWYAAQAKTIKAHAASSSGAEALMLDIQRLAADGGRRAEEALAQRETDQA